MCVQRTSEAWTLNKDDEESCCHLKGRVVDKF